MLKKPPNHTTTRNTSSSHAETCDREQNAVPSRNTSQMLKIFPCRVLPVPISYHQLDARASGGWGETGGGFGV